MTIEDLERAKLNIQTYGRIQEIVARCQFTDLKDKNGKESYRCDLIIHSDRNGREPIEIIWENGSWKGRYTSTCGGSTDFVFILKQDEMSQAEIIGNIHENPELIKKEKP